MILFPAKGLTSPESTIENLIEVVNISRSYGVRQAMNELAMMGEEAALLILNQCETLNPLYTDRFLWILYYSQIEDHKLFLKSLIKDNPTERYWALMILYYKNYSFSPELLRKLLSFEDDQTNSLAVQIIGEHRHLALIDDLQIMLTKSDPAMKSKIYLAMAKLGYTDLVSQALEDLQIHHLFDPLQLVELLDGSAFEKELSLAILTVLADQISENLRFVLKFGTLHQRKTICQAFINTTDEDNIKALINALKDESSVSIQAAKTLLNLPDFPEQQILEAFNTADLQTSLYLLTLLAIKDFETYRYIIEMKADSEIPVIASLSSNLIRMNALLENPLQSETVENIEQMDFLFPTSIVLLHYSQEASYLISLYENPNPENLTNLREYIKGNSPLELRIFALDLFYQIPSEDQIQQLIEIAMMEDSNLQFHALYYLSQKNEAILEFILDNPNQISEWISLFNASNKLSFQTGLSSFLYLLGENDHTIESLQFNYQYYGTIIVSHLNVREDPQSNSQVVDLAALNDLVRVLDLSNENWVKIETDEGIQGWVHRSYIQIHAFEFDSFNGLDQVEEQD